MKLFKNIKNEMIEKNPDIVEDTLDQILSHTMQCQVGLEFDKLMEACAKVGRIIAKRKKLPQNYE